ncbi:hypothetical protein [Nocardia sp. IFM 10818]
MSDLPSSPEARLEDRSRPSEAELAGPPLTPEISAAVAEFIDAAEALLDRLFGLGLRLHHLHAAYDRAGTSPPDAGGLAAALTAIADDLDALVRDIGVATFALTRESDPARHDSPAGPRPPHRHRSPW